MKPRIRTFLLVAILSSAMSEWVLADGVIRDGMGAISTGRGGTNIAHSDNIALIHDNPAGLANLDRNGLFEFGFDTLMTDIDYTDRLNNADADVFPYAIPQIGFARKSDDGRFAYGFGIFAPAGFGADHEFRHRLYGKQMYRSFGALVRFLPAAAVRITDELSIGASVGLGVTHVELEMPHNLQSGLARGMPALVDIKATGFAPTWTVGLQYQLSEQTTIGLAYTGETRFRLQGDADADVTGFKIPLLTSKHDIQADLVWPRSLGFGVKHRFNAEHRTSVDVIWYNWSTAFDELDLEFSNGTNPLFNLLLSPTRRDSFPADWHDSISVRIGHEFFFTPKDVFRIGYTYHPVPVPDDTLFPLLVGILEHAFSIGYGHQWEKWRFDAGYQYSTSRTRGVRRSGILGGDFNHSTNKAQAHWIFFGFSYGF